MGALATISSWTSEDDQKLKNAMAEAGASLESLAKGAVQFSQKFTLQELEDHWHSLPNDPDVSVEASGQIKGCEHSPSSLLPSSHILEFKGGEKSEPAKRKNEIMGNCYHAMLKRVRKNGGQNGEEPPSADHMIGEDETVGATVATPADVTSDAFHTEPCNCIEADLLRDQNSIQMNIPHNFEEDRLIRSHSVAEEVGQRKDTSVCKLDDAGDLEANPPSIFDQTSISDANYTFNNFGCSSPLPQIPIWSSTDIISSELPHDGDANIAKCLGNDHSDAMDQIPCDNIKDLAPITDSYLAVLSDYLMDLTDEEELLMEFDGKDAIGAFDLSSFLMDFPEEDNISNITVSGAIIPPDEHLNIPGGVCAEDFGSYGHNSCTSEAQMLPSIPAVNPEFPELRDGVICCFLNTEDPEIPCNDDVIFPSPTPSSTFRSGNQRTSSSAIHDDRCPNRMNREENDGKPYSPPQMIESQILSELGINLPFINHGIKSV